MASAPPNPQQLAQQNAMARSIVLQNGVRMIQNIGSFTVTPSQQSVINFTPRNVGLTTGFLINVSAGVTNGASTTANLTGMGTSNLLSSVTYTDLQNLQRVQTTGYHLALLDSARKNSVFGGVYTPNVPMGYGNNWPVFSGPSTIAAAGTATLKHSFFVPLAYSHDDLTGAVYTNVVNASQNLQVVINTAPFVGATDPLNAVYSGNATGAYTNTVTVTVYQFYIDQIPFQNGVPILPIQDLNIVYDLKNTANTGISANQDFPFAYPNMRRFLSTFAIFDNGGTFNTGSDVAYWSLTSANSTNLFKLDPYTCALMARHHFMADPPPGVYYFDSRRRPIETITFGNMSLNLNATAVNANAQVVVLTEAFQQVNQIPYAASLSISG